MSENIQHPNCLNCKSSFPEGTNQDQEFFCTYCGQSNRDSRLSFGRLIKDAISNVLNLDSRLIHTFRDILYPSKLTTYYIRGKRKYYVNPARLFIFTLLALITLSLFSIKLENSTFGVDQIYTKAERSKLFDEYNSMMDTLDVSGNEPLMDIIKKKLFNKVRSLKTDTIGKDSPTMFNLGKPAGTFGISTYDAIHLTQKELFEKYKIENFWDKINVGQYIRFVTNPAGGIKYIIKNLTWAVFITALLISFFMKLIYIRKPYYLVEHVVLILNGHSMLFLFIAFNICLLVFVPLRELKDTVTAVTVSSTFLATIIIQFRSLKKYYKQGFFRTLLKQIMINSAYIFIFNMVVIMVAIISLILY